MSGSELDLVSTAEAAEVLGVAAKTVNEWVAAGRLRAAHKLPGLRGAHLFHRGDVERLAAERARRRCPTCGHRLDVSEESDEANGAVA